MNANEPVAWAIKADNDFTEIGFDDALLEEIEQMYVMEGWKYKVIPLYTHPVKEQKCIVKDCENHKHEGSFNGDLCSPCYQFIAHGIGTYSQAYRNTHPYKPSKSEVDALLDNADYVVGIMRKEIEEWKRKYKDMHNLATQAMSKVHQLEKEAQEK